MKELFGGTKLGIASTILSVIGAILVGAGSIGATLNGNVVMTKELSELSNKANIIVE